MKANDPTDGRLNQALAAELRAWQGRRGWSRAELQRETGIPKNTLERIMLGRVDVRVDHLFLITGALGVPASAVLAAAESAVGVTDQSAEPPVRYEDRSVLDAVQPSEVAAKLDKMVERLRGTGETGTTGASAENRS